MKLPVRIPIGARRVLRLLVAIAFVSVIGRALAINLANLPSTRTGTGIWQDGVWQLYDEVARQAASQLGGMATSEAPMRVSVAVGVTRNCPWGFSSLTSTELAEYLRKRSADWPANDVEMSPLDATAREFPADAKIELEVDGLAPCEHSEELRARLRIVKANGTASSWTLRAMCPPAYRGWFVRARRVHPAWLVAAFFVVLVGASLLCWGAQRAFLSEWSGGGLMKVGATMLWCAAGFLFLSWIVDPAVRDVAIPRQQIDVVVEASDAVLFPVPSDSGEGNPQAQFIHHFVSRLQSHVRPDGSMWNESGLGETGDSWYHETQSFWEWARCELLDLSARDGREYSLGLESARRIQLYRIAPGEPGKASLKTVSMVQLSQELSCQRLGRETSFVVPWEIGDGTRLEHDPGERLVVMLTTGNVGSLEEARQLDRTLDRRCQNKQETTRVISVMLLDVPRSGSSFEFEDERAKRLCKVSDWFTSCNGGYRPDASAAGASQVLSMAPLVNCDLVGASARERFTLPQDLDAERQRLFGHVPPGRAEESATRLAQEIAGLVLWERVPVFCLDRTAAWAIIAIAGLLLLFFALQDELTVLDSREAPPRGQWLGHLAGLLLVLLGCLFFCYCMRDSAMWTTRGSVRLALWGLVLSWCGTCWLPAFLGRGSGELPPPARTLHMKPLFWLLTPAVLVIVATVATGVAFVGTGGAVEFAMADREGGWVYAGLMGAVALLVLLNGWFLFDRFARGARKCIVPAAACAAALLLAWPLMPAWFAGRSLFAIPLVLWAWSGIFVSLYVVRWLCAGRAGVRYAAGDWDPGCCWLVFVLAGVPVAVGVVRGPFLTVLPGLGLPGLGTVNWIADYWVTCLAALAFSGSFLVCTKMWGVWRKARWRGASLQR